MNIIGKRKIYLSISAAIVGASVLAIAIFGFRQGIDFTGGTLWQFGIGEDGGGQAQIEEVFKTELGIADVRITASSEIGEYLARTKEIGEPEHQEFLSALKEKFPEFEELSFKSIGPSVGAELRRNAMWAIALVLLGISLYIAFSFRKASRPVSSWKYGWVALITLFHDVAVPAGLLSVLGHFGRVEIDTNFIVALLVVMGFSVHDTIVIFDRIRENLIASRGKIDFEKTVNESVNQNIARSVNTSLTLILVLIALIFVGPAGLTYFMLTLLVGTSIGVYSSIFVASPLLVVFAGKRVGG